MDHSHPVIALQNWGDSELKIRKKKSTASTAELVRLAKNCSIFNSFSKKIDSEIVRPQSKLSLG